MLEHWTSDHAKGSSLDAGLIILVLVVDGLHNLVVADQTNVEDVEVRILDLGSFWV
jgi:hypothetical protein